MLATGTGGLRNKRTGGDSPNYSIVEIGRNTEKSHGDLRILAVTQTPVENHQLTLMGKTLKRENDNNNNNNRRLCRCKQFEDSSNTQKKKKSKERLISVASNSHVN